MARSGATWAGYVDGKLAMAVAVSSVSVACASLCPALLGWPGPGSIEHTKPPGSE